MAQHVDPYGQALVGLRSLPLVARRGRKDWHLFDVVANLNINYRLALRHGGITANRTGVPSMRSTPRCCVLGSPTTPYLVRSDHPGTVWNRGFVWWPRVVSSAGA